VIQEFGTIPLLVAGVNQCTTNNVNIPAANALIDNFTVTKRQLYITCDTSMIETAVAPLTYKAGSTEYTQIILNQLCMLLRRDAALLMCCVPHPPHSTSGTGCCVAALSMCHMNMTNHMLLTSNSGGQTIMQVADASFQTCVSDSLNVLQAADAHSRELLSAICWMSSCRMLDIQ